MNKIPTVIRAGRVNRMAAPVIVPRFRLATPDTFIGIGIALHETSEGPAIAITIAGPEQTTATALIPPAQLAQFMGMMTETTARLADAIAPADGEGTKQ